MAKQARGYSHNGWDPAEYDYEAQYHNEEISDGIQLDHSRLYITNIPPNLTEDGLRTTFSRYGGLIEAYLSRDPSKKYGLVKYETAGQAKMAMMKMNRMEPLKLIIAVARKPTAKQLNPRNQSRPVVAAAPMKVRKEMPNTNGMRERCSSKEETASVSSRSRHSRKQEDHINEDEMDDLPMEDEINLPETIDSNLHLELENLKMEQLKVKEEQLACKQRMILLKQAEKRPLSHNTSNRCILPDGRIIFRNTNDRSQERDGDASFGAGAGDSLKIPGLQRVGSRMCVACGAAAESFCARCGVTPYCSQLCQRRDWQDRHKAVCHNLARLSGGADVKDSANIEPTIPQPAPLRRPHSPVVPNDKRQAPSRDDSGPDKTAMNQIPPDLKTRAQPNRANRGVPNGGRTIDNNNRTLEGRRPPLRHELKNQQPDDENWGADKDKPIPKTESPAKEVPVPRQAPRQVPKPMPPAQEPKPAYKEPELPKKEAVPGVKPPAVVKPPASILDVTPTRKLVPKNYLVEELSLGDTVLLSVDTKASECRVKRGGFVCLSMHEKFEPDYNKLCEDYVVECEADTDKYTLTPGESFSHFNPEDGGWYRARCLTPTCIALLDSSKIVTVAASDKRRKLPEQYESIPEFCCLLQAEGIKIGANLKCTLLSKNTDGFRVSLEDVETGAGMGGGEVLRWLPEIEYPQPVKNAPSPVIPEVPRPSLVNNSRVVIVDATGLDRVIVRPVEGEALHRFESVLQDVALYGISAKPLKEPPQKGQILVGKFSDDQHYRALCKRTNVKQNKYLIEYIEYGNLEACPLERLYPCPEELSISAVPTTASVVRLSELGFTLSDPARAYLDTIKDSASELVLTLPDSKTTAPSDSLATLTLVKNGEELNKKVEHMCTPEWKKLEERGGDVIEVEPMKFCDVTYLKIPTDRPNVSLQVLDISTLEAGLLSCCELGLPYADRVFTELAERINEYCNSELCKEPYLPQLEELCIAQLPPCPQWYRAVLMEQVSGAGGTQARVYYIDYGNTALVPVSMLRKMLPEFVRGLPALAVTMEISNFPKDPTTEMLCRAVEHMKINEEGRGVLIASRCRKQDVEGMYSVDAPSLITAMIRK